MKKLSFKIRLPKTVLLSLAGLLLVGGAGAGGAVYLGYLPIGKEDKGHDDAVEVAGVACTTLDMIKLQRNGQRWLRKIVTTSGADGVERVRTALRVAGVMAKSEKADLYQVMVLDQAGPTTRAERRGPAIGAEVLFAPHPDRLPEMTAPFEARYVNATANEAGLFFGEEVVLSPEDVRTTLTRMTDRSDCLDPNAAVAAADAAEGHGGGHAKPAEGHGEARRPKVMALLLPRAMERRPAMRMATLRAKRRRTRATAKRRPRAATRARLQRPSPASSPPSCR